LEGNPGVGMDWLTTLPLIVGVIGNVGISAVEALAERLSTLLLALVLIGGVSAFAFTIFASLSIRRVFGDHAAPSVVRH
jgi:hypothetical protein